MVNVVQQQQYSPSAGTDTHLVHGLVDGGAVLLQLLRPHRVIEDPARHLINPEPPTRCSGSLKRCVANSENKTWQWQWVPAGSAQPAAIPAAAAAPRRRVNTADRSASVKQGLCRV